MARKEKRYHFIYKTTNVLTNRYYIGMHSTDNLDDGYLGSGKRLRYSINKYGEENHIREIIEFLPNRKSLINKEKEIVNLNEIAKTDCMNLMVGGEGGRGFTVEQQKKNAVKSNKKQKQLKEDNPEWYRKKCENISLGNKKIYDEGKRKRKYFYDWNGKKHSDETKNKMSNKAKLRIGNKNSQFGTCWITNGNENLKIKKVDKIPDGWKLGRVMK